MTVRVVIADDQALMRTGFRLIFEAEPDIELVGEAADGAEAVRGSSGDIAGRRDHGRADARLNGIEATRRPGRDGAPALG